MIGKGIERLYSELGKKMTRKGLIQAHIWLGVAISALALYTYTIVYIFNYDIEENGRNLCNFYYVGNLCTILSVIFDISWRIIFIGLRRISLS